MTHRSAFVVLVLLSVSWPISLVQGGNLVVPGDFPTIQGAIEAARDGDCVLVSPGTYVENIDFLGRAIAVRSTDGPGVTIIDGGSLGTVVTFDDAEGPDSILEGFTITNGSGTLIQGEFLGGGILCQAVAPTLRNNIISQNTVLHGGGGLYNLDSSPTLTDCTFSANGAFKSISPFTFFGDGGGVLNDSSSPVFTNCAFSENFAFCGGALFNDSSSPTLIGCQFTNNRTDFSGGAVENRNASLPTMTHCTFTDNSALNGGGMLNSGSSPRLIGCTFRGNCAVFDAGTYIGGFGGAIQNLNASSPALNSCTFSANRAEFGGGGMSNVDSSPIVVNSIFWADLPNEFELDPTSDVTVTFTDIQDGWPGEGNIDIDPEFVAAGADLHLQADSPCLNLGTLAARLPDTDRDGEPRVLCAAVDIGSDEVGEPPTGCPFFQRGDGDGNGILNALVDGVFVIEFCFVGGPPPICPDAVDIDDDGDICDIADPLFLLNHGFLGGPAPPPPYFECGVDPTLDRLLECAPTAGCL